tara:strand:+ start:344 stop:820 length:477 start_codon:yes stop_codon:yes gene_type:complete
MKLIGQYTARGIVSEADTEAGNPQKIPLFDGSFETAYRVIEFKIWGSQADNNTSPDCIGKLSKNDDGVTTATNFFRADDDNQIAWAISGFGTDGSNAGTFSESIIDPDNLIVEDLYVYARTASTNTDATNYLVIMEKYEIDDWQGALAMARDRAQGDL